MAEVKALQTCSHIKEILALIDFFEDFECSFVLTQCAPKLTLAKYLENTYKTGSYLIEE